MRKQPISLTLPPDVLEKISELARRAERSRSEIVSRVVRRFDPNDVADDPLQRYFVEK
jgi:metal-responsive CopG/Arc/MetJ family transcriptional regulator